MPHDNLSEGGYYSHHAKYGAYQHWPANVCRLQADEFPNSQKHITMSAAVINSVDSLNRLDIPELNHHYSNPNWNETWKETHKNYRTSSGFPKLDLLNFTAHHSLGPLVGNEYFEKELIFQRAIYKSSKFLDENSQISTGFFPTELGFSPRLVPVLEKLGIKWSAVANVHFSRTLKDYPYLDSPGIDTMISPPNRADLRNVSEKGSWKALQMFNERQVTHNKFPFAATPKRSFYVDPTTSKISSVVAIPVEQASSWEEGYQGSVTAKALYDVECESQKPCYFVIAHDGDNSSGRAGSEETWRNSGDVTYRDSRVEALGVDEYLKRYPVASDDFIHIQDGSWIDTRDSSSDPSWYHWHLPFGVWEGQRHSYNLLHSKKMEHKTDWYGRSFQFQVNLENGFHYLERNFALLQAALNYAKTSEEIFLNEHPNHWQPSSKKDHEISYNSNQLNPYMISNPIKGLANLAELSWYFLLHSMDSGFGYYDENQDDHVKPTLSFNQSLFFSKRYMKDKMNKDKTGPSVWWPQRYPYNPGSVNQSKAEGWATLHASNKFALYTYAYDLNKIKSLKFKIRRHKNKRLDPKDISYELYEPKNHNLSSSQLSNLGKWQSFEAKKRNLKESMNGVAWQKGNNNLVMQSLKAKETGDLYYRYFEGYKDELIDYYVEATDMKGNVSRSPIQHVYVGTGYYTQNEDGKWVESKSGRKGQDPFK